MKKRIISAIVMITVILPLIIIGDLPFTIFMALFGVCGLYELVGVREKKSRKLPLPLKIIGGIFSISLYLLYNKFPYFEIIFSIS